MFCGLSVWVVFVVWLCALLLGGFGVCLCCLLALMFVLGVNCFVIRLYSVLVIDLVSCFLGAV